MRMRAAGPLVFLAVLMFGSVCFAQRAPRTIRLETEQIEGKIKKPQVALIALERRPQFEPIVLTESKEKADILKQVDPDVFENRVFEKPFAVKEK
ncbi:MAG: hypothetical protein A2487_19805 [Candidatus Raymondbacteria bacterium RifOxyC12_full_50_8]|uniref:Uncharacterized protein n=1 Tax=Candidatus Raymondbacteria bacterium RIFOXYD12_FULL_49_13 TaxID=1817890 RepID=A0A1F7FBA4_UNCRA|nr:MAG: hypothetical protein A2248_05765 [Candidatus Raymondbacteria bacterium RIFOXYA2_FULL_49_16]OGJ92861.1 MAG: hypothetical protein A2350_16805 [Candidatus Raymondbacteria bacterium RifOxyB12_full_50_8]OGK03955.1 MAG: hypothetical protein A2519_04495 [Candidatus Raymondbacteria bacterium RIFOXYD12_FULL_49_13]OGK06539.1 MAG: hypothetical protein A2487_19805 [Candidatus Raymondbacteria bacterium RifOxyC12_full_50_8]OGP44816.1 MAG: hypothetical protein A2324_21525 [Candidatus Raymondbacteria b